MRVRFAPSRRLALVFVLALGALVVAALLAESARVPVRTPLVPRSARAAPVAAPLEGREARRGSQVYRLELSGLDPAGIVAHDELQLFLESATPGRALVGGRLELRGTGCALVAQTRDELTSRQPVVLRRTAPCPRAAELAGPIALDLVVELRGEGALALLAFEPSGASEPAPIRVAPTRAEPRALDVRGAFVDYPPPAPRLVLLSAMWHLAPGAAWLLAFVGLATALACAGCLLFPTHPSRSDPLADRCWTVLRGALGAALLAASPTLLYAVLAPPLSGPDEPYHLLGFAALVKDESLARDTVAWMGETHLWRIRQKPAERFRTIDVGRPYVVADDQLRPTEVAMRSAIVARLWRALAPVARGRPAPRALLALRLVNVVVFALAVGIAVALALLLVGEPYPQWLAFPFLFVPALPFFAMHVSETATLCAVYVLLASSLAILTGDGPRAHWGGLPLGLATGLMLAGGRSPWPLVGLVSAALVARALLGSGGSRRPTRVALVFWGGFGLGASAFFALIDEPYRLMTESYATQIALFLPASLRGLARPLLTAPSVGAALVGSLALVGAAVERALAAPREWVGLRLGPVARPAVARAAAAAAAAVVLSLLGSLFLRYPQLPTETTYVMPGSDRLAAVLATMATMFRLTEPSFLLASSFWVGFGWLDTLPGAHFQGMLIALVALALVALLLHLGRHGSVRRLLWLVMTALGATAALVLYTLSTQDSVSTLVGRHLIGWYLSVLAVIGTALTLRGWRAGAGERTEDGAAPGARRAAALLVIAGSIHAYCLWFVLQRYF